jgi:hypothetical protein
MAFPTRKAVIDFLILHGNNDLELDERAQELRDHLKKSTPAENAYFCYAVLGILLSQPRDFSEAKIGEFLNNEWSAYLADCAITYFSVKSPPPMLIKQYVEGLGLSTNILNGIEEKLHTFFAAFYNYIDGLDIMTNAEAQATIAPSQANTAAVKATRGDSIMSLTKSQLESCISLGLYYFKETQKTHNNVLDKVTHHNNGLKSGRSFEIFLLQYRVYDKVTYDLRTHIYERNNYYHISDDILKYYRASLQCDDSDADSDYASPPDSPLTASTPLQGTPLMASKSSDFKRVASSDSISGDKKPKITIS